VAVLRQDDVDCLLSIEQDRGLSTRTSLCVRMDVPEDGVLILRGEEEWIVPTGLTWRAMDDRGADGGGELVQMKRRKPVRC
jgi:hypothetical protein